jgi:exo-1,4-beta-D-glucosaminidase
LDDSAVAVINRTYHTQPQLSFEVSVTDINGASLFRQSGTADADTSSEKEILQMADVLQKQKGVSFISLQLRDKSGKPVSQNVYWISPNHDFTALQEMSPDTLQVKVIKSAVINHTCQWTLQLSNTGRQLAFFVNPQLMDGGEEVLPSFWSDNYFSIPAGESKTVTVSCAANKVNNTNPYLKVEGWNIKEQLLLLSLPASNKVQ